jgi:hypothetical protein
MCFLWRKGGMTGCNNGTWQAANKYFLKYDAEQAKLKKKSTTKRSNANSSKK